MTILFIYLLILFSVSSLLLAWFKTTLPVHMYHFLHKITKLNLGIDDWNNFDQFTSTRQDWEIKVITGRHPLLADLLTCPICFSTHLSAWITLFVFITQPVYLEWHIAILIALSIPVLANLILNKFK